MGTNAPIAKAAIIKWVNGMPEPAYKDINPSSVKQLATTALSLPYEGEYNEELGMNIIEARFEGMSNAEVMWVRMAERAAQGDLDAAKILLDRVLGKPKQSVESTSMSLTYPEYLELMAKKDGCNK